MAAKQVPTTLIKQDPDGIARDSSAVPDDVGSASDLSPIDYIIAPRDEEAARAFGIFAEWVYNEGPQSISTRGDVSVFLKAYKYAREYDAWSLQNQILEKFREHHVLHAVHMDDLTWLINKFGDDANATPLTRYILEQIAHEICSNGVNEFLRTNAFLKHFLEDSSRKARFALFSIIAQHARRGRLTDPASSKNDWKVHESGDNAGKWSPQPFSDA